MLLRAFLAVTALVSALMYTVRPEKVNEHDASEGMLRRADTKFNIHENDGRFTVETAKATVTVIGSVKALTLSNGQPVRVAVTVTRYNPPYSLFEGKHVIAKVMEVVYNCAVSEAYVNAVVIFDENENIVFKDLDYNVAGEVREGTATDEVRKHACKVVPDVNNLNRYI